MEDVFPPDYIRDYAERSLKNLGLASVDLLQFHVWEDAWARDERWQRAVEQLRRDGLVHAIGVSINRWEPANAIDTLRTGLVDSVQVIYNIFDQNPEDELFPACHQHNIGVIVRAPLDEGGLTGRITPESTFDENNFRSRYFRDDRKQEVYTRVQSIAADLGISLDALSEIALRYILSNPVVSTVIPGMRSARNVERNIALSDGYTLSPEQLQKLKKYRWVRDFYKKV